jgi:type II secretory pathway component GspD/PulD (secretin)
MRYRTDAATLRTLLVIVLCCAGISSQIRGADPPASNSITLLRPRVVTLNAVANDQQIQLSAAPKASLVPRGQVKLPGGDVSAAVIAPTRSKLPSTTLLPPAGAVPGQRPRVRYIPLPIDRKEFTEQPPAVESDQPTSARGMSAPVTEDAADPDVAQGRLRVDAPGALQLAVGHFESIQAPAPIRQVGAHQAFVKRRGDRSPAVRVQPVTAQPRLVQHSAARPQMESRQPLPAAQLQPSPRPRASRPPTRSPIRQVADNDQLRQLAPANKELVPIASVPKSDNVDLGGDDGLVTLIATGADLPAVLRMIADHHNLNLVLGPDISGPVTVSIRGARLDEVLDAILGVAGFSWHRVGNLLYVTGAATEGMDPRVQGRTVQVYPLDYVSSTELESVANGLLSAVGTVHTITSASDDQLKTREMLVVEDTAAGHNRIAQYIAQVDIAPRQVLIEAHVLQVALGAEERHGINLQALARIRGTRLALEGAGFAEDNADGPLLALRVDGSDMDALIQCIRQQTNSRTLASPKVSVVNHQEAKIQIGQRLPYSVATTTQTSTVQSVQFLEVGIVLTVTPVITEDGHILMNVLPKVSGGKITENGFPEEDTTEVQTTVLMPDGGGIVIGGLIREENFDNRAMVPGLGRVPVVGRLFRKTSEECRRNELIVALVTHVLPDVHDQRVHELQELDRTIPSYSRTELRAPGLPFTVDGACYHMAD